MKERNHRFFLEMTKLGRERTCKLCEIVGKDGGFIMNTEVGELERSNPELTRVWIDATREFGVY